MTGSALPLNKIITGDCIEILNSLPENCIDLIFADPPYYLQLRQELWRPNMTKVNGVDDGWDKFNNFTEYDNFTRKWLIACRRVLKDNGTLWGIGTYHNIFRVGAVMQDLDFWILNNIAWIKTNPMPNFRGMRFTNAHETLIWVQKKRGAKYTFNHHSMKALNDDLQMRSDWYLPLCTGSERIRINGQKVHSTQKPEALLYRVILASSNSSDVVLDPFLGVGTTAVVAKKLHRNWIGIERREDYVKIAKERIEAIKADQFSDEIYSAEPRHQPRVPFGTLLENGLLHPGQRLYFGTKDCIEAIILANGHIRVDDITGSIHQVGSLIRKAPCNGWEHWYYDDETTGKRLPINNLRQKFFLAP